MIDWNLANRDTQWRLLRFLVVGGGSAAVQFGVLALLRWMKSDTLAFSISWVLSTTTHYLFNRFWALPSERRDTGKQFGEYLFTIALSFAINVGVFRLCQTLFGLGRMWATFFAIPPSTIIVFALLNYRVFRARG